jgi:hypothetical protein
MDSINTGTQMKIPDSLKPQMPNKKDLPMLDPTFTAGVIQAVTKNVYQDKNGPKSINLRAKTDKLNMSVLSIEEFIKGIHSYLSNIDGTQIPEINTKAGEPSVPSVVSSLDNSLDRLDKINLDLGDILYRLGEIAPHDTASYNGK